jgi:hypothetical protein
MQTYNYISQNYHFFLTIRIVSPSSRFAYSMPVLLRICFFWDVTLYCMNDTFLTPPGLIRRHYYLNLRITLPQRQTVTCQVTESPVYFVFPLFRHSKYVQFKYMQFTKLPERRLCSYSTLNCWRSSIAAEFQLLFPVWPDAWTQTLTMDHVPLQGSVNVLGNAQPEEAYLQQLVSCNMKP